MRCLLIVGEYPISPNFRGGGPPIYYDHLTALARLGHQIHLWHYATPDQRTAFERFVQAEPDVWREVQSACVSVRLVTKQTGRDYGTRVCNRLRSAVPGLTLLPAASLQKALRSEAAEVKPEFIWAEHFEPAWLAATCRPSISVYSHHDWLYRIKALRHGRAEDARMRQLEESVARRVAVVVSGSATECTDLRAIGCRRVIYAPVSYPSVPWDAAAQPTVRPSVVHLGGMQTTATRGGLERFFDVVWPALALEPDRLMVVGDLGGAGERLLEQLRHVTCTGFVKDLRQVLRPYDLHIIPWEHNTGQRTRLPVAFNYGQVVVATRASVACFPEAQDGVNCRLLARLEEMPGILRELLNRREERARLGRAARATFDQCFSREASQERLETAIASLS